MHSLSPLDGRYKHLVDPLRTYLSEEALMRYRTHVEIQWLQHIAGREDIPHCRSLTTDEEEMLQSLQDAFGEEDITAIRAHESVTNHDVKAVEYYLKEKIQGTSLQESAEWIHFALTSEDVNNLAYSLMIRDAVRSCILPELIQLRTSLVECVRQWKGVAMLARTHGQPASPTTMGKEFCIFVARIDRQIRHVHSQEFLGKIAGASGNFNAHSVAFPQAKWLDISQEFVESLGLTWNGVVPQIEPHDFIAEICDVHGRLSTILIDMSRDIWGYISLGFFGQQLKKGEVGSSAMPHKVNPIDFENAEGNLGIAHDFFQHFTNTLPISRWQRDLSDSTVLRNVGVGFGHFSIGVQNIQKGLKKLRIQENAISQDLQNHPEILAEAIQTVMRSAGVENPYEKLKEMTRGKAMTQDMLHDFSQKLDIPPEEKKRLLALTPERYIGLSEEICEKYLSGTLGNV